MRIRERNEIERIEMHAMQWNKKKYALHELRWKRTRKNTIEILEIDTILIGMGMQSKSTRRKKTFSLFPWNDFACIHSLESDPPPSCIHPLNSSSPHHQISVQHESKKRNERLMCVLFGSSSLLFTLFFNSWVKLFLYASSIFLFAFQGKLKNLLPALYSAFLSSCIAFSRKNYFCSETVARMGGKDPEEEFESKPEHKSNYLRMSF